MRKASTPVLIGVAALIALVSLGGAAHSPTVSARPAMRATVDASSSEIPPDAKRLELDKPIVETIDPNSAIRFYTFEAKGGQLYRLTLDPKTGTYFTTTTIMTLDLQTIVGGTLGENLISGSLVVRIPADGTYAVSIEYADINDNNSASGSYEISLSAVKPK